MEWPPLRAIEGGICVKTSRRHFFRTGVGAGIAGAALLTPQGPSRAQEGEQAPGFYRLRLGSWMLTVLSDGNLVVPTELYAANADKAAFEAFAQAMALPRPRYWTQTNVLLIDQGERRILVDCGSGGRFQETAGHLAANLEAAGVDPAEIDLVVITHAHPDHCWGLLDEFDEPAFPEAEVVIGAREHAFWTEEGLEGRVPEAMQAMVVGARRQLEGVADQLRTVEDGAEVASGVRLEAAYGHTPGHSTLVLESEGEVLFVSADTFNHPVISLAHPDWHLGFDFDGEAAARTRRRVLEMLAGEGVLTLGYHMPWPGLGRVVRDGEGFRWMAESVRWSL